MYQLIIAPALASHNSIVGGFDFLSFIPLLLVFIVFYIFIILPQQKKSQKQKEMLDGLRRGDRVLTNGGIIGTITKILSVQEIQLEIAEGVRVRVLRSLISQILTKGDLAEDLGTAEVHDGLPPAKPASGRRSKKESSNP